MWTVASLFLCLLLGATHAEVQYIFKTARKIDFSSVSNFKILLQLVLQSLGFILHLLDAG